ncbi:hypothetical protein J6G99_05650 [bacterium]|nr:hypothetical protein [bacterium]
MQNQIFNGISSSAVKPQTNYTDVIQILEEAIQADMQKVQMLVQQGTITPQQGSYLINMLGNKAQEISMYKQTAPMREKQNFSSEPVTIEEKPIDIFQKENPDFFGDEKRSELLNYIRNLDLDKDEISKIAQLAQNLENSAVENYLKQSAHDKSMNDENSVAKSKLTSYAQNASSDKNLERIFTREDIGKMSGDEFLRNEKLIMEQVKQGLIK